VETGILGTHDVIACIDAALNSGWERAKKEEEEARRTDRNGEFYYYRCDKRNGREAALLLFCRRHNDERRLHVPNIVFRELRQVDYDQYNAVLADFTEKVLSRINDSSPVLFVLNVSPLKIEHLMPEDALAALRCFSSCANKDTGSTHPMDRERWIAFLVLLHRSKHQLDSESLRRWLLEAEHWPDEWAHKLTCEFEFTMEVLQHADATRPR
jgi:hypothetical protein